MKTIVNTVLAASLFSFTLFTSCQKSAGNENPGPEPTPTPPPPTTAPVAGTGTPGSSDGPIASAQFNKPKGIILDAAGNMYIADWGNERIRKVTAANQVSTMAGSTRGFADGAGTAAKFNEPSDVAVDGQGNVYVADINNFRVRKITPDGTVTTFAGSGTLGYTNGTGTEARFRQVRGVATDKDGNVFVADMGNHTIRKITPAGVVTTFAGNGQQGYVDATGTAARFKGPRDIAVDQQGNVYVVDSDNNRIRKITPAGAVTTFAGDGTLGYSDGAGTAAKFNSPKGIAVDKNGNVYVADTDNNRIRKITPAGLVTTLAGDGTPGYNEGATASARFNAPRGIAVDADGKFLYVVDQENNRIRKIALQ